VVSLLLAVKYVLQGNVLEHKRWMIRNFGVGAGSIWVRVIGALWAAFDLNFMKSNDMYRAMNNVVLTTGFAQGILFSEWWLATTEHARGAWSALMGLNAALVLVGARDVYAQMREARQVAQAPRPVTLDRVVQAVRDTAHEMTLAMEDAYAHVAAKHAAGTDAFHHAMQVRFADSADRVKAKVLRGMGMTAEELQEGLERFQADPALHKGMHDVAAAQQEAFKRLGLM